MVFSVKKTARSFSLIETTNLTELLLKFFDGSFTNGADTRVFLSSSAGHSHRCKYCNDQGLVSHLQLFPPKGHSTGPRLIYGQGYNEDNIHS